MQNYSKAIVETVHSPFLVLTANLQVRSANRSFYKTFKLVPDQTERKFIYELGEDSWNIPVFRGHLNELLGTNIHYLEFELKQYFPGVGQLAFIVNAYRLLNEESNEILLAFINISDVQKANQELTLLNEHLAQFVYVASHDLQEPLRKIQTFSNYLTEHDNKKQDGYSKKYLDKINETAARMSILLHDLLSYSLLLKNREKEFVAVDLNKTINTVCKDLKLVIEEKKAVVNVGTLPEIPGEPVQLNQLFYNLINNALKFNNATPIVTITAEKAHPHDLDIYHLTKDRSYVALVVKDNGIGFDQKYAEKIFSIFQRLKDKPDAKGSGMGLAICKKIVEEHGGGDLRKISGK